MGSAERSNDLVGLRKAVAAASAEREDADKAAHEVVELVNDTELVPPRTADIVALLPPAPATSSAESCRELPVPTVDGDSLAPQARKLAWIQVVDDCVDGAASSTIFEFAKQLDGTVEDGSASATASTAQINSVDIATDAPLTSDKVFTTSAATLVGAEVAGGSGARCGDSHVIDIELSASDGDRLGMEQARQIEKSLAVSDDMPAFGWYDYYQLGGKLAYQVLRLRRNISSRTVFVEEQSADKAGNKPRERLTASQLSSFAHGGLAFNNSTQELIVRQLPRRRPMKSSLTVPRKRRRQRQKRRFPASSMFKALSHQQPKKPAAAVPIQPNALSQPSPENGTRWSTLRGQSIPQRRRRGAASIPKEDKTRIGYAGCAAVFQALRTNTALVSLALHHAGVDDPSMCALAAMLRRNMTLTKLDLTGNRIGPLGIKELSDALEDVPDSSLIDLNLSRNRITDRGMREICRALRENETLMWLDVSWNQLSSLALLEFLREVRENFVLRSLSIHGSDLDEDEYCANIESKYGKNIAVALRHVNPSFSQLRLTNVDACIPIDKIKQSRWVDLSARSLAEVDALVVAGLLPLNNKLLTLDLSNNVKIERWGVLEILSSIKHCKTLKDLRLASTGLYAEVAEQVGELVASNQTLETIVMHEAVLPVQVVRGSPQAQSPDSLAFRVSSEHHFDRWILARCLALNRLTQELNGLRLPDASKRQLLSQGTGTPDHAQLCEINLSGRALDHFEASFLGKKILHHLSLGRVALNSCCIDGHGGAALADGVRNHASLHTLEMENNALGVHGGRAMAECIEFNASLTYLNLSWNKIGNDGAVGLQRALSRNRALVRLDLRGNNLSAVGIVAVSRGLQANVCLQQLYLRWNTVCPAGAEALAEALTTNKCLKLLDIEHHTMGARGVRAFTAMLAVNKQLQHLNMTGDDAITDGDAASVGAEAARELADVLAHKNRSLTHFYFGQNRIGKDGVAGFNDVLKFNASLVELDLSMSQLDAKLSLRFFECLAMNKALRKLNLAHNCIANEGMTACIRALERNSVLRELNVADNWITEEPLALLLTMAKLQLDDKRRSIRVLQWLCLTDNSMTERTRAAFRLLPPSFIAVELEDEEHRMASG